MLRRKNFASERDYQNHKKNLKAVGDAVRKKFVNAIALDIFSRQQRKHENKQNTSGNNRTAAKAKDKGAEGNNRSIASENKNLGKTKGASGKLSAKPANKVERKHRAGRLGAVNGFDVAGNKKVDEFNHIYWEIRRLGTKLFQKNNQLKNLWENLGARERGLVTTKMNSLKKR